MFAGKFSDCFCYSSVGGCCSKYMEKIKYITESCSREAGKL